MASLEDLFLALLREVHFAERQIGRARPLLARTAENRQLREIFARQRIAGRLQEARLRELFRLLGHRARAVTSEAVLGLLQDCEDLLEEAPWPGLVRDAALIACGQALLHYEMSRYGTLHAWARAMGRPDLAALLWKTLEEDRATGQALAQIAADGVHREACPAA